MLTVGIQSDVALLLIGFTTVSSNPVKFAIRIAQRFYLWSGRYKTLRKVIE